jgi:hypothetical protein
MEKRLVTLELSKMLPNIESGLANSGFLFGAGTSVEAGYPVMAGLTRSVVGALDSAARGDLDEVLGATSLAYDDAEANPNIEVIADLVMQHAITSGDLRFTKLEERLRQLVTEAILSVSNPNLDHHVRFLELLKKRGFGRATNVYIFTTNYDVLFELAGALAGVVVETGFVGSVERFFDQQRFATASGALQPANRFLEHPVLTVRLIKLHGSVSWTTRNGVVIEQHPASITSSEQRVMVLPRRRKVMDTLQHPFDALFTVTSRVLGVDCKYLASCGFSFGDDHINQNLMTPSVNNGRIKLFALCMEETDGLAAMKSASAFSAGFQNGGITAGSPHTDGTDCWKFSKFVDLFE